MQQRDQDTLDRSSKPAVVIPRQHGNQKPKLYNGRCISHNKGFRQLAFFVDGDIYEPNKCTFRLTPVPFLAGSAHAGSVSTTQEIGDLTVRYEWDGDDHEQLSFTTYPEGPEGQWRVHYLYEGNFMDVWKQLKAQHQWIEEFLERQNSRNSSSIIPISIVPPEQYEANKRKAAEVSAFVKRFGIRLPFSIFDIPLQLLQLREGPPPPEGFRDYLPVNVQNVDGTPGRVEQWYSSTGTGAQELQINPSVQQLNPDPDKPNIIHKPGKKGIVFSQRARLLIRVVTGAIQSNTGMFYGGSVHLYNVRWSDRNSQAQQQPKSPPKYSLGPPPPEEELDPRPLIGSEDNAQEDPQFDDGGPVNTQV